MALSNAEKQKRWRDKRNRLAKEAEVANLIKALAGAVKGMTDLEIAEIGLEVQNRLADVMSLDGTVEAARRAVRQRAKQTARIRRSRKA